MKFVDEVSFAIASGHGGAGAVSFRREKYIPRGGPDGGDGGAGGSIVFRSTHSRNTLVDFRFNKVYRGGDGQKGAARDMTGRTGDETVLLVPVGTVIYNDETDEQIADLAVVDAEWRLTGGRGGKGNHFFATPTHRTPLHAQEGEPGTELRVRLELRLLADVGLLGLPNAGKSTFISRVSAARPKIADYPFTTLVPNLGVVSMAVGESFVVADLPGLIEGAAEGAGLGHRFLKHLDRCRLLLHLVAADVDGDPVDAVQTIEAELEAYDPELAGRDTIVVLSKIDVLTPEQREQHLADLRAAGYAPYAISAVSGEGLQPLLHAVWSRLRSSFVTPVEDDPEHG
ncbi:MAG: GTPase ObgE [Myxococcota bacterium]